MLNAIPIEKMVLESDSPSMMNKNIYDNEDEYNYYFKEKEKEKIVTELTEEIKEIKEIKYEQKYKNHPMSIIQLTKKLALLRNINLTEFSKQIFKNHVRMLKNLI